MTIPLADLIPDPTVTWDWVRLANIFLSAVLIGEVGNVLWHYRGQHGTRARHVRLVGISSASYSFAVGYVSVRLLGEPPSALTAIFQSSAAIGGLTGIAGVFLILRTASGKAVRSDS